MRNEAMRALSAATLLLGNPDFGAATLLLHGWQLLPCGRLDILPCGWLDIWTCGWLDIWTCGRLDIWTCGRLDIWTYGRLDFWTCGYCSCPVARRKMRRPHLTFCYIIGIYGKTREVFFLDKKRVCSFLIIVDHFRWWFSLTIKKRRSLILIQWKKG